MILSESYLRQYARKEMNTTINESMDSIRHTNFDEESGYDIFISHSSFDREVVCALYDLFVQDGFKAYLDYRDKSLTPLNVTYETGEKLRKCLKKSKCLAYVATANVIESKWCPWELGLFDGVSDGRCCILPIIKQRGNIYRGQEFLGLYPYLVYEKRANTDDWIFWVHDSKNPKKYISLKSWIKGNDLIYH